MTHDQIVIEAQQRKLTGKKVAQLRRNGILPGVLYGRHLEKPIAIQMDYHTTSLLAQKLTSTTLVTLNLDEKKYNAIVRDRQRDVIFGRLTHLDFLAVVMDEVLRAAVSIELVGEAPVLKAVDAVITQAVNSLELEALPADLPERIEVDISGLETPDDVITVKDLKLGDKVTVLTDPDEVIVSVTFAAQEVEPEEAATGEEPEVMEKGKKEEEAE
ncbi:MAG TPA: 50S ribosomal protein L25 [Anaerolineaceae bacterium]|nr:50S ribosomal protein L25 [Chloroflexota bacterium]HNY84570.1 50S ribosomal protein L25 [Anaerolineaceae bacterium]